MSRRFGLWQLCTAFVLLGAATAPAARAEQYAQQQLTVVFVRMDAGLADAAAADGLEAQLGELSAKVVSAPSMSNLTLASQAFRASELAREAHALGTIWFSPGDDQRLRVYVYDAKHRQLASRTLSGAEAAEREELAVVLRSAISALIAGEQTALEPVTIPPPQVAPPPPPNALPQPAAPKQPWHLLVGAAYAGTTYASGAFEHGLQVRLDAELGRRFLLGLSGTWFEQARLAGGGAEAVLERYPLELSAGYAFAEAPRFRCFVDAGLVLERVTRSTRVADPRLHALPDENRYRFAVAPALQAAFEPAPGLLAFAGFGAEIATDRYDYVVQSAGGSIRLAPRTVRPRLEVGVVVRLW